MVKCHSFYPLNTLGTKKGRGETLYKSFCFFEGVYCYLLPGKGLEAEKTGGFQPVVLHI